MPHYEQINVPCNVTTWSATDHKYGGLSYVMRQRHDGNTGERYLICLQLSLSELLLSTDALSRDIPQ